MPENGTAAGKDSASETRTFSALPKQTEDGSEPFHRCVAELIRLFGIEVTPVPGARTWVSQARVAIRKDSPRDRDCRGSASTR
ncbi:hypothetical protein GCM10011574_11670 [Microbispora bryophytorum]|uniref:Uncharacterized protein n=1 Tax=Microbispora bryophytorum TaxID=1460882 RepID=A0A8H9LBU5_9ACTN|nr:hypothetical protein GCM10011574_11670 [Microbispora bryophytorum]